MQVHIKRERTDDQYSAGDGHAVHGAPPNGHRPGQNRPPPPLVQASQVVGFQQLRYAAPPGHGPPMANKNPPQGKTVEPVTQKVPENQIDYPSFKGMFGWTTIDGVNVPYIFRKDRHFVSVRVVEQKLLSRYPNSYPDELGKHQPLTSYFITNHEAHLLNEINLVHCGGEFGQKQFNTKDLIVLLEDFVEFHKLVKKTFPEHIVNAPPQHQINQALVQDTRCQGCGWIQVNNTVTPYVNKNNDKFVPLSVMRYAASLNVPARGVLPEPEECDQLNKACKEVGFNFTFSKTTRIVSLSDVMRHFPITVINLPSDNPLEYAQYLDVQQTPPAQSNLPNMPPKVQQRPPNVQQANTRPVLNPAYQNVHSGKEPGQQPHMYPQGPPDRFPPPPRGQGPGGGIHPAFMDPRYMFSFNRFPYNLYNVPCGPPNVTVNPMTNGFGGGQMPMPPPPYQHNQQMTNGQVRPPRTGPSPSRSSSAGSTGSTGMVHQRPPSTNQTSPLPWHEQGNRPQTSPTRGKNSYTQSPTMLQQQYHPSQHPQVIPGQPVSSQPQARVQPSNYPPDSSAQPAQRVAGNVNGGVSPHGQYIRPPPLMSGPHSGSKAGVGSSPPQAQTCPPLITSGNTVHPNSRKRHPSAGQMHPSAGRVQPPAGQMHPSAGRVQPSAGQMHTSAGQMHPSARPVEPSAGRVQSSAGQMQPSAAPQHGNKIVNHSNGQNGVESPTQVVAPVSVVQAGPGKPVENGLSNLELPSLTDCIKGVWLGGKSISCMHLNGPKRTGKFCLVEAVCKLYFNGCSVNEFLFALENVLKIPLVTCMDEEEKAFIHYYSLPVTVLKCNKMIDFDDLDKFFPQLTYVFRGKIGSTEPHKTLSQNGGSSSSSSPDKTEKNSSNILDYEIQQNADYTPSQPRKRANPNANSGPANKQPCRRLDEAVRRLHSQQRISENGEPLEENNNDPGGPVIVLD